MPVLEIPSVVLSAEPHENDMPAVDAYIAQLMARCSSADGSGYSLEQLEEASRQQLEALRPASVRDAPVRHIGTVVAKTVTDCLFRCKYPCYEYQDESWRALPPVMSDEVVAKLGQRIGEYAARNQLGEMNVIFHGGEPLYMRQPEVYYDRIIPLLRDAVAAEAPDLNIRLGMVTLGALLRPAILDVLLKHNVGVRVSVDGGQQSHDSRRVTKEGGRGTHQLVMRGLDYLRLPEYRPIYASILAVVNIDADPIQFYNDLLALEPPRINLFWAHATHDKPPAAPTDPSRRTPTAYAEWMLPIFWRWRSDPNAPKIPIFSSIMRLALGGTSETEHIGPEAGDEVVVRTDGSVEDLDALKVAGEGIVATGMNVATHSFEQVAEVLRGSGHLGTKPVAADCRDCPVLGICGGGHIAQRFSSERPDDPFNNASVYCPDLKKLTGTIGRATRSSVLDAMVGVLRARGVPTSPQGCC